MRNAMLGIGIVALAAGLAAPAGALDLARQQSDRQSLAAIVRMAADGEVPLERIFERAAAFGLDLMAPEAAPPAPPGAMAPPRVSLVTIDLVLSQLAMQTGANYHVALRQAQHRPEVLIVESGTTTLAGLYEAVSAAGLEGVVSRSGSRILAHIPIAVWSGATLALAPGEALELSRTDGAFLLVAGRLVTDGARIEASGEPNARLGGFEPFVVVALRGSAAINDTDFSGLGFAGRPPMTGVTLIGGGLFPSAEPSFIRNSRFEASGTLALVGVEGAAIENNRFTGATGPALLLSGGSGARVRHNLIAGSRNSHGIKLTAGAADVAIAGNIVVGNADNGAFADGGAADLVFSGNLIAGNARSGMSLASANCVTVNGNLLLGNGQSGLVVRDSAGAAIEANRFLDNDGAGIAISRQPRYGRISLADNRIEGNKVGIQGSTTARLDFARNDLAGQAPRLLDGELVQFAATFLDVSASGEPLTIEGLEAAPRPLPVAAARPQTCLYPEGV